MKYDTLLDDTNETECLDVPFGMVKHGSTVDMRPRNLDDNGSLYFDE